MSWAKFDDRYDDNRKVKRAWRKDRASIGLHAMAITYCSRHHTDGIVDIDWLEEKLFKPAERAKAIAALEDAGLFEKIDDERWRVHDYLEYNPSAADAADRARGKAEAGRRGGLAKAQRKRIGEPMRQQIASDRGFSPGDIGPTPCGYCSEPITVDWTDAKRVRFLDKHGRPTPEIDHIDPVSNNGAHEVSNMKLACLSCNRSKGASTHLAGASEAASGVSASKAAPVPSRPVPSDPPQPPRGRRQVSDGVEEKAAALGFDEWLSDLHTVTGKTVPAAGTKTRHTLAGQYVACCNELPDDPPLPALKLATRAAHADPHRKENGYDGAENVLRPTKILNLVDNGRRMANGQLGANDKPPTVAQIQAAQARRGAAA